MSEFPCSNLLYNMLELIQNAERHSNQLAIIDQGKAFSYADLLDQSQWIASCLIGDKNDLNQTRVAFMIAPSFDYVAVQWGIWRAGGIAVPLCVTYPFPSLQYVIEDTQAAILVVAPEFEEILLPYRGNPNIRSTTSPCARHHQCQFLRPLVRGNSGVSPPFRTQSSI